MWNPINTYVNRQKNVKRHDIVSHKKAIPDRDGFTFV